MRSLVVVSLLLATGCIVGEEDDVGSLESASDDEVALAGDADLQPGESELEGEEALTLAAGSLHRIYATDANLHKLRNGCFGDGTFDWDCPSNLDGHNANFVHKKRVGANSVEVADNGGTYWGECVSLVKAATKNNTVTGNWRQGSGVFSGLRSGTAIATFSGGRYVGHTAIFLSYVKNSAGATIGIRIADQNWGARIVKRHVLYKSGSGHADADAYYAVLVP